MPKRCAVWLDHAKAIIVRFSPTGDPKLETLESGIEGVHKSTGGARAKRPYLHGSAAKHSEEERRNQQLSKFYNELVDRVREAPRVVLMGPGLAKQELGKALDGLPGTTKPKYEIQSAERMTERQLVARARKDLDVPAPL